MAAAAPAGAGKKQTRADARKQAAHDANPVHAAATASAGPPAKRSRIAAPLAPGAEAAAGAHTTMLPLGKAVAMRAAARTGAEAIASAKATRVLLGVRLKRTDPVSEIAAKIQAEDRLRAADHAACHRAPMVAPEPAEAGELCEADLVAALEGKPLQNAPRARTGTVATGASATLVTAAAPATPSVNANAAAAAAGAPSSLDGARAKRSVPSAVTPASAHAPSTPPRPAAARANDRTPTSKRARTSDQSAMPGLAPSDLTLKQLEAALACGTNPSRAQLCGAATDGDEQVAKGGGRNHSSLARSAEPEGSVLWSPGVGHATGTAGGVKGARKRDGSGPSGKLQSARKPTRGARALDFGDMSVDQLAIALAQGA